MRLAYPSWSRSDSFVTHSFSLFCFALRLRPCLLRPFHSLGSDYPEEFDSDSRRHKDIQDPPCPTHIICALDPSDDSSRYQSDSSHPVVAQSFSRSVERRSISCLAHSLSYWLPRPYLPLPLEQMMGARNLWWPRSRPSRCARVEVTVSQPSHDLKTSTDGRTDRVQLSYTPP